MIDGRRQGAGFDRLDAGDRLCNAARAHHVTGRALGGADIGESTTENLLDRGSLYRVTLVGGGAVRVDVADVGRLDTCLGDRLTDARLGASAFGMRRRDMMCVTGVAAAGDLGIDMRTACQRVLLGLEHQRAAASRQTDGSR